MWLSEALEEPSFVARRSPVTVRNYRYALVHLAAAGISRVRDVSRDSVRDFVAARMRRVSARSVGNEVTALLAVLRYLADSGRAPDHLAAEVRRVAPRLRRQRQFSAAFLTPGQLESVCSHSAPLVAFAVRLAAYTGLRLSELLRLEWRDVDLASRRLHVRSGKTGPRTVSLCAPAVALLEAAKPPRNGRVVETSRNTLQGGIREARRRSGVRFSLGTARHTRASWWVAGGVPLAVVAQQMGHGIETCVRFYAGLGDGYNPVVERGAAG